MSAISLPHPPNEWLGVFLAWSSVKGGGEGGGLRRRVDEDHVTKIMTPTLLFKKILHVAVCFVSHSAFLFSQNGRKIVSI